MPVQELTEYLDSHEIGYEIVKHARAYTAQEIAAAAHIPGKELAKTVIIKVDSEMVMAVLPAYCRVNVERIREATGAGEARLATEREFEALFPGCELGAMPPFGNLYGTDVFVDENLAENDRILFNAGSHTELIRMSYGDFAALVKPKVLPFSWVM
jgi:Ala-tRNA(Pro) deacylase